MERCYSQRNGYKLHRKMVYKHFGVPIMNTFAEQLTFNIKNFTFDKMKIRYTYA